MKRQDILTEAARCVCTDREQQYGAPEDNFAAIAELWEPYIRRKCVSLGSDVTILPTDIANLMILLKLARNVTGSKADNWVDIAGYAACGGELDE